LGLSLVAGGLYVVGHRGPGSGAPLDHIDAESRKQLERVLLEHQRERAGESR
jgi:hypothetical protein